MSWLLKKEKSKPNHPQRLLSGKSLSAHVRQISLRNLFAFETPANDLMYMPSLSRCTVDTIELNWWICGMGIEDQKEEREVLDSIFPDEITGLLHSSLAQAFRHMTNVPDLPTRYLG